VPTQQRKTTAQSTSARGTHQVATAFPLSKVELWVVDEHRCQVTTSYAFREGVA